MTKFKLIIGIIFMVGTITLKSQDTIPNSSFENWYSNTSPVDWQTVNELLPAGTIACNKTSNSYEGDFALSMKTIDLGGIYVPGVASLGTIGMGFTEGGIPFTERPGSLTAYFKHPSSGDAVMIAVQFYKQGIEIGGGYWSTSDSIPDFTMLEAPVYFTSTENPDTLNITIVTDQYVVGSSLVIDALQFEFPPVVVENAELNPFQIYPNPCYDHITIKTQQNFNSLQLVNMKGEIAFKKEIDGGTLKIDVKSLPEGLYILKVNTGNSSYSQKIIKR